MVRLTHRAYLLAQRIITSEIKSTTQFINEVLKYSQKCYSRYGIIDLCGRLSAYKLLVDMSAVYICSDFAAVGFGVIFLLVSRAFRTSLMRVILPRDYNLFSRTPVL